MRPETFTLSQKELQRVAVIAQCTQGDLTVPRAADLLELTARQIQRLKARYRQGGAAALVHANRGRPSARRTPEPVRRRALVLARTVYAGFNDHHLCEKLAEVEGLDLGRGTLRRILRAAGQGSPRKRRAPVHRQRRTPRAREGEMLLLDGSPHDWLEGRGPRMTLLAFQDDANSRILDAEFFLTETAAGYLLLLERIIRKYGVPLSLYGDRHSIFLRNDEHWSVQEQLRGRQQPTQFGRALEQLGITYIAAQTPQAKGRIERLWGTCQDRLVSELRLAGADHRNSANRVLRSYLPVHNHRFARGVRETVVRPAWRPAPQDPSRICCFIHERTVGRTTSCSGADNTSKFPHHPDASALPGQSSTLRKS
jgi:transposase